MMWEELQAKLDTAINSLSANHADLKTIYLLQAHVRSMYILGSVCFSY